MRAKILVVDDTVTSLNLLERILDGEEFDVRLARSGAAALTAVATDPPDLLLLDVNLPDMTGYTVCERLKANPHLRHIPVIFVSARADVIDKVHAFEVGGVDYITKPFHFAEVIARVRTQVELIKLRHADQLHIARLSGEILERQRAEARTAQLARLIEGVSDAIMTTDPNFVITSWNHGAEQVYGWRPDEAVGQQMQTLLPMHGLDYDEADAIRQVQQSGVWQGEVRQPHRDGHWIDIYSSVTIIHDAYGRISGYVGINHDITMTKQARQHQMARELAEQKAEFLREFLANMSHDLRTPLSVINTSLYLLERYDDADARLRKIEDIKVQARRLEDILQNLITMSRLDTLTRLNLSPVDVNELLREVGAMLATRAEQKSVQLGWQLAPDLPRITADSEQVYRVFTNLIDNALHYTPAGGMVTVMTSCTGSAVEISVSDTGIGISADDLPYIFDRFFRSNRARTADDDHSGSGLGLAIVRSIVDMHQGHIEVTSELDRGSTFRVSLPIEQPGIDPKDEPGMIW